MRNLIPLLLLTAPLALSFSPNIVRCSRRSSSSVQETSSATEVQQQIDEYLRVRMQQQQQGPSPDDVSQVTGVDRYLKARGIHKTTSTVGTLDAYLTARKTMTLSPAVFDEETAASTTSNEKNVMQKIKDMGPAGIISYGLVQVVFQGMSFVICLVVFQRTTGHWPDFSDPEDAAAFGGGAFAFVNIARLAVPLRVALALGGASWIKENVLERENKNDEKESIN